jgi:hypothetical protein
LSFLSSPSHRVDSSRPFSSTIESGGRAAGKRAPVVSVCVMSGRSGPRQLYSQHGDEMANTGLKPPKIIESLGCKTRATEKKRAEKGDDLTNQRIFFLRSDRSREHNVRVSRLGRAVYDIELSWSSQYLCDMRGDWSVPSKVHVGQIECC